MAYGGLRAASRASISGQAVLEESEDFDLVVLGAAPTGLFRQIVFGSFPEQVARREVVEETGCELQALHWIGEFVVSPGMSVERINLYCGWVDSRHADGVHGLPHEGEEIRVVTMKRAEAVQELFGRLNSTSVIMALQWLEAHRDELLGLIVREGGRTIPDAISELREAVDFMRYYGAQAKKYFGEPILLPGPTGERNTYVMRGKGVFIAISPWNFPLAIYTGQITAALAAGNAVLAKPAAPTTLVAYRAIRLLHEAGVPQDVLHFVPCGGRLIGECGVADPRVAGVVFTGSTGVAQTINQTLAHRDGPIGTLIAETGGQNAMFVDSSALPQQLVQDVIRSAFHSAGQRCSALRVLFLQEDVADTVMDLLAGAMQELVDAYGGEVTIENSAMGGAAVEVRLPPS